MIKVMNRKIFQKNVKNGKIKNIIKCIRNYNAPGPDKLKNDFIKYGANKLIKIIKKLT